MGGRACLGFALTYPERTLGLVLGDTTGGATDPALVEAMQGAPALCSPSRFARWSGGPLEGSSLLAIQPRYRPVESQQGVQRMRNDSVGWWPAAFVLDLYGVMTTGQFACTSGLHFRLALQACTSDGKAFKLFGPVGHDALLLMKEHLPTHFVSGDRRGFGTSHRGMVEDMKFTLGLFRTGDRVARFAETCSWNQ